MYYIAKSSGEKWVVIGDEGSLKSNWVSVGPKIESHGSLSKVGSTPTSLSPREWAFSLEPNAYVGLSYSSATFLVRSCEDDIFSRIGLGCNVPFLSKGEEKGKTNLALSLSVEKK